MTDRVIADAGVVSFEIFDEMFERRKTAQSQCELFLRDNLGLLYRVAASYEAEPQRREDLLQDISLAIWQAAARFESRSSFKTFALRIAHNRGVTHCAKASRSPELVNLQEDHKPQNGDPALAAERAMLQESLLAAVRRLPLAQRQIVIMALEGSSYQEISEVLEISASNVGVRLNRAKAKLRELLHG